MNKQKLAEIFSTTILLLLGGSIGLIVAKIALGSTLYVFRE